MLHEMRLQPEEFDNIKMDKKIMEVRLNDEKRKKISPGDIIKFYKLSGASESITVEVEKIHVFFSFKDLYSKFSSSFFGYDNMNLDEILKRIYSIYSHEQEEKYGVILIMFKVFR